MTQFLKRTFSAKSKIAEAISHMSKATPPSKEQMQQYCRLFTKNPKILGELGYSYMHGFAEDYLQDIDRDFEQQQYQSTSVPCKNHISTYLNTKNLTKNFIENIRNGTYKSLLTSEIPENEKKLLPSITLAAAISYDKVHLGQARLHGAAQKFVGFAFKAGLKGDQAKTKAGEFFSQYPALAALTTSQDILPTELPNLVEAGTITVSHYNKLDAIKKHAKEAFFDLKLSGAAKSAALDKSHNDLVKICETAGDKGLLSENHKFNRKKLTDTLEYDQLPTKAKKPFESQASANKSNPQEMLNDTLSKQTEGLQKAIEKGLEEAVTNRAKAIIASAQKAYSAMERGTMSRSRQHNSIKSTSIGSSNA